MNRLLHRHPALRTLVVGIGPAVCFGSFIQTRPPLRCDSPSSFSGSTSRYERQPPPTELSPDKVRQISSGSVTGFAVGLVVALFSRSLVLIGGLIAASLHLASRYGWNVAPITNVLRKSSLWKRSRGNPWFTASFLVTFILAAFVHL